MLDDQRGALTVRVDLPAPSPRCPPQITARRSSAKRAGLLPPGQTFPSPIDKIFIYRFNHGRRIPATEGAGQRPLPHSVRSRVGALSTLCQRPNRGAVI